MRLRHFFSLLAVVVVALGALGITMLWRARTSDADTVAALLQTEPAASAEAVAAGAAGPAPTGSPAPEGTGGAGDGPGPTEGGAAAVRADIVAPEGLATLAFPELLPVPRSAAPVRPEPTPLAEDLGQRLDAIVSSPAFDIDSPYGVVVLDSWGREVYAVGAEQAVVPASTNKLVVAAAALQAFSPEQRFRTAVATTAPPDADGVVDGDLLVIGGGDPVLASDRFEEEIYPARPHTPVTGLVDAVEDAGVTEVTGAVVAVPGFIPHLLEQQGLRDSYFDRLEATRTSGLSVNMGRRMFVRERDDALLGVAARDPAVETAAVVTALLDERDISVAGDPRLVGDDPPAVDEVEVLGVTESPPLRDLLGHMVRRSDNNVADTLFRTLGALYSDGSWGGSSRAVRRILAPLDLDWTGVQLSDGSGLATTDRLTAAFLARLDEEMMSTPQAAQWRAFMAVAGESGTLSGRYRNTPAEGTMFGKTGALRDVRSLAGSVDGPSEDPDTPAQHRYHFAVLGSDLTGPEIGQLRRMMDLVVLSLAAEQHGCDGWAPPPPGDAAHTPEDEVCPA